MENRTPHYPSEAFIIMQKGSKRIEYSQIPLWNLAKFSVQKLLRCLRSEGQCQSQVKATIIVVHLPKCREEARSTK